MEHHHRRRTDEELQKTYEEAVINGLAEKMKSAGFSINGKLIPGLIGVIFALIAVVYGTLVQADVAQKADIKIIQTDQLVIAAQIRAIATNTYILCRATKDAECIKPESIIQ